MWADSQYADFESTATDQFSVRAGGGARFETGGAGMTVDGLAVFTGTDGSTFTNLNISQTDGTTLTNLNASQLTQGTVPDAQLSGTYSSALMLNNAGNVLAGDGSALTQLDASALTHGTVPDARLSTNVAFLDTDMTFAGMVEAMGDLKAHRLNVGTNHTLYADFATIAGGKENTISSNSSYSAIGGGKHNELGTNSSSATIAGGYHNEIGDNSNGGTISGGSYNEIGENSW